jgi:hypothetical protein
MMEVASVAVRLPRNGGSAQWPECVLSRCRELEAKEVERWGQAMADYEK